MTETEFSRVVDLRSLTERPLVLTATPEECRALAGRFGLVAVESLTAEIVLVATGAEVAASGRIHARIVQSCAVSGEDLPANIDEPVSFRFVPQGRTDEEEEVELAEEDLDEIPYTGTAFDVGEAVAQSLALAIDPYACGPEAERTRQEAGLSTPEASGPFAVLAGLKKTK